MEKKRIVVAGTNFGGYTAALKLRELLKEGEEITVVANSHQFLFTPSLIWLPFGLRKAEDITFDVRPIYKKHGITFLERGIDRFDPARNVVCTPEGDVPYDYLVIATGPRPNYDAIPGLKPGEFNHPIVTLRDATATGEAWKEFLKKPGPVVIGAVQGAACFGAAYEFLFNMRYQLARHKIEVPLTFVTAEPFLTHFGIGGFGNGKALCEWMFEHYGIQWRTEKAVKEVRAGSVVLDDGEELQSAFTSLVPPFLGIDAVMKTPDLALPNGFIETSDEYRHGRFPNIYAAGVAVQVNPPGSTKLPCGVPKTGYPTEQMAEIAAWNIAQEIYRDRERKHKPFAEMNALCVMDAGNMGMMILGDHMMGPRKHEVILPGPQAHWAKLAFEKYFLSSRSRGHV